MPGSAARGTPGKLLFVPAMQDELFNDRLSKVNCQLFGGTYVARIWSRSLSSFPANDAPRLGWLGWLGALGRLGIPGVRYAARPVLLPVFCAAGILAAAGCGGFAGDACNLKL